jgi:hypothetical protein
MNVGPAIEGDLLELGIRSVRELASQTADALFQRLQHRSQTRVDPCVYDTFLAIIHEARTGEKTPWFAWTAERKRRQSAGELDLRSDAPASSARARRSNR